MSYTREEQIERAKLVRSFIQGVCSIGLHVKIDKYADGEILEVHGSCRTSSMVRGCRDYSALTPRVVEFFRDFGVAVREAERVEHIFLYRRDIDRILEERAEVLEAELARPPVSTRPWREVSRIIKRHLTASCRGFEPSKKWKVKTERSKKWTGQQVRALLISGDGYIPHAERMREDEYLKTLGIERARQGSARLSEDDARKLAEEILSGSLKP